MRVWKLNLEVGESLPRQDLAFPSRWISQENWCLLMSCQGSRGHCYHRKLSLSSQGMWDIRVGGGGVFRAECWNQAAQGPGWGHPGGTSPEQLRSKGQLSLAVTFQCLLDRAKDLRTAFTLGHCLWALLLLVHADSAELWHWIAVPLQRFQEEKVQNQKLQWVCLRAFESG